MSTTRGLVTAKPEEVGFSSECLARIRPAMQKFIDREHAPCVITLAARHGKVAHFEIQGMMDIESKKPVEKDTIFRMYSMTKPITGVAALMLYEEGHFQLEDPISRFIPAFKNPVVSVFDPPKGYVPAPSPLGLTVPAQREITVRDCLTHTTGLASARRTPIALLGPFRQVMQGTAFAPGEETDTVLTMKERVERLAKLPLSFHPGSAWEYGYSNSVAGVLVEVISGKTLDEFFRERIFEPLGMNDTSYYLPEEKIGRFATNYALRNDEDKWKMVVADVPETSAKVKGPKVVFGGGGEMGGVLSTVADYARFAQMLLNGGELDGNRLLSRKTVDLMTTNHTGDLYVWLRGYGYGWGLGVSVRTEMTGRSTVGSTGEYGWGGAACTQYFADPKEDMFGLMFSQVMNARAKPDFTMREDFHRLVYQALI